MDAPIAMPRYVILLHEVPAGQAVSGGRGTHWDLMLEQDGRLRTWALATEPAGELSTRAEQLSDHRIAYLEYEGPVSGNRGSVRRWEAGEYELLAESPSRIDICLQSAGRQRFLSLVADGSPTAAEQPAHFWIASFSFAPIRGPSSSSSS